MALDGVTEGVKKLEYRAQLDGVTQDSTASSLSFPPTTQKLFSSSFILTFLNSTAEIEELGKTQQLNSKQLYHSLYQHSYKLQADGHEFFTSYDEVHDSFDVMGLQENLLRGIYAYGFEKPSAIQQRGIVPFCQGLDVIQQVQSGTGKTATFWGYRAQLAVFSVWVWLIMGLSDMGGGVDMAAGCVDAVVVVT